MLGSREPAKTTQVACGATSVTNVVQIREPLKDLAHPDAEALIYVVGGEGLLVLPIADVPLSAGTFSLVPRGTTYTLQRRGRSGLVAAADADRHALPASSGVVWRRVPRTRRGRRRLSVRRAIRTHAPTRSPARGRLLAIVAGVMRSPGSASPARRPRRLSPSPRVAAARPGARAGGTPHAAASGRRGRRFPSASPDVARPVAEGPRAHHRDAAGLRRSQARRRHGHADPARRQGRLRRPRSAAPTSRRACRCGPTRSSASPRSRRRSPPPPR